MLDASLLIDARPFAFKGKQYVVKSRDLAIEWTFADWVAAEAGLALARMKPRWPADFYVEQTKLLSSRIAAKQLRWGSEDVHNASWSEEGQRQLLYLKMKRGEEQGGEAIERDVIDDIAKDADKYAELLQIMMEQDYPFLLDKKTTAATLSQPDKPPSAEAAASTTNPSSRS